MMVMMMVTTMILDLSEGVDDDNDDEVGLLDGEHNHFGNRILLPILLRY